MSNYEQRNYDFSKGMTDAQFAYIEAERRVSELQAKNAELRDLMRDIWRFTGMACKKYPRLFDPAAQGRQAVQLNMIDSFEQRMQELGIGIN